MIYLDLEISPSLLSTIGTVLIRSREAAAFLAARL
jgi:hypothetical protein